MKKHVAAALAGTMLLTACSKSLDERFAQVCAEQRIQGGKLWEAASEGCANPEYISPESKEEMVSVWESYKEQKQIVEELKEEGRKQGFDEN